MASEDSKSLHLYASYSLQDITKPFKSTQWSPDASSVITNSEDNVLRTFVLPQEFEENVADDEFLPRIERSFAEPIHSFSIYPFYDLSDPSTTLVLSSIRDQPIRLTNALLEQGSVASYPFFNTLTEASIAPHSITFGRSGTTFVTGSESLIAVFDILQDGQGPFLRAPTIPSKRHKSAGVGMKGIVSALDISANGLLAAGTFTRNIGLYASEGQGDEVSIFSVAESGDAGNMGITQVKWSPGGRYLYVAERNSDNILVYDIRVAGRKLGSLRGRKAFSSMRMGIEATVSRGGYEIWAGGVDGKVRVWQQPEMSEGDRDPSYEWNADQDAISSVGIDLSGDTLTTTAGLRPKASAGATWNMQDEETEINAQRRPKLGIWAVPSLP
ncbi:MAG: hypothetical protein M1820_003327 [Bogoriella megaspora]|nr:MAG: hypothetical protein M1820_003327 [Bogoriella megaspora]